MKSREATIADLTDALTTGTIVHPRISLATILEDHAPLVSNDDLARLIQGDSEARLETLDRLEDHASQIVRTWLEETARGRTLVSDVMEREAAEAIEEEL